MTTTYFKIVSFNLTIKRKVFTLSIDLALNNYNFAKLNQLTAKKLFDLNFVMLFKIVFWPFISTPMKRIDNKIK